MTEIPRKTDRSLTRASSAFLIILLSGLLLSCAASTERKRDFVGLSETFSETGKGVRNPNWWLHLNDPILASYIDRALGNNFTILAAWEKLAQVEASAIKAGADFIPALDAKAGGKESWTYQDSESSNSSTFSLGLTAAYELDLWGRIASRTAAAKLDALATGADLQTAAISVAAEMAAVWYQMIENQGKTALLLQQKKVNEDVLKIIRVQFKSGKTGIADVMQQKLLIESNNGELISFVAKKRVLENSFAILLGVSPGKEQFSVPDHFLNLPPLPDTGAVGDMLQNRPDLQSSYLSLLASDKRVAEAVANRLPKLSLSVDLSTDGERIKDLFDDWFATLAANLLGPVIDGGSRKAEVARTEAIANQQLFAYRQKVLGAVGEVEKALVGEKEQQALIANLNERLALSKKTVGLVGDRYKQGSENYQRVLTALLSFQGLEQSILSAKQKQYGYRIDLYRALGGRVSLSKPSGKAVEGK